MDEADVIVIAGMGGVLITELMGNQLDKAKKAKRIILQPMYAQEVVRPFLWQHGFTVIDEALTREGKKLYQVLAVVYDETVAHLYERPLVRSLASLIAGDPLLEDWLCDRIKKQRKIVNGMRSAALPRPNLEQEEELLRDLESLRSKLFNNRGM